MVREGMIWWHCGSMLSHISKGGMSKGNGEEGSKIVVSRVVLYICGKGNSESRAVLVI